MSTTPSLGQRWQAARPTKTVTFWACAACVAATMVVGFTWGGWTTGGTAQAMAKEAALGARNELAAAVCVDRFRTAGDAAAQLVALTALQGWSRGSFVEKGGWAAMPDKVGASKSTAKLCADKLTTPETPLANATPAQ